MSNIKVKEEKVMKKLTSVLLSLIMIFTVITCTNSFASAAGINTSLITNSDIEFENRIPSNSGASGVGGISVGTANNRLFTLKANETNQVAVLYFYSNMYSTAAPKKIVFKNNLLGHANAMAIDDDYLYVAGWQRDSAQSGYNKSRIMRISRAAVNAMSDGDVIEYAGTAAANINKTINGTTYNVLKELRPVDSNGAAYTAPIDAITRYKYDKTNGIIKFIISYNDTKGYYPFDSSQGMAFTIATLQNGKFTVSRDPKDIFFVKFKGTNYQFTRDGATVTRTLTNYTKQDIFYDVTYGLYLTLWDNVNKGESVVLRVNLAPYTASHTGSLSLAPSKLSVLDFTSSKVSKWQYESLEIESLAFVKKTSDKTADCLKVVIGCNTVKNGAGNDSYFILKNARNLLTAF